MLLRLRMIHVSGVFSIDCYTDYFPLVTFYARKLVDSPICLLCKQVEETLSHMFWDCPKIQVYWFDIHCWLHANFSHCSKILLSGELIILGSKVNTVTDRIFDLFMLIAEYHIFTSSLQGTTPHLNVFI